MPPAAIPPEPVDEQAAALIAAPLVPLPAPPFEPWPRHTWAPGPVPVGVDLAPLLDQAFDDDWSGAVTQAVVIVHRGRVVAERYGGQLEFFDRPPEPVGPGTPLLSWSMAKSVVHAAIGILIGDGVIDPSAPAPVPAWSDPDDPRHAITVEQLLEMRSGLAFFEDYEDVGSDAMRMLFGDAKGDMATFAADKPLEATPGSVFAYSSGTSNILSGIVARAVGPGEPYRRFLHDRLFEPIAMGSAMPELDEAGTFVGSSFLRATALDYARFGLLYLRDGVCGGRRILPSGWADHGRRPRSVDPEDPLGDLHGAHFWAVRDGLGTFRAAGYESQSIQVTPSLDLIVVRLGKTPEDRKAAVVEWRAAVVAAFAAAGPTATRGPAGTPGRQPPS